jgi:hypothetical protein
MMHYRRWQQHGDPSTRLNAARGGLSQDGYRMVYQHGHPNAGVTGRIPEHRLIMCTLLGRALLPGEEVHHKNGLRTDNRLENLELWVHSQPAGQRARDLLTWAREIVARYDPVEDKLCV